MTRSLAALAAFSLLPLAISTRSSAQSCQEQIRLRSPGLSSALLKEALAVAPDSVVLKDRLPGGALRYFVQEDLLRGSKITLVEPTRIVTRITGEGTAYFVDIGANGTLDVLVSIPGRYQPSYDALVRFQVASGPYSLVQGDSVFNRRSMYWWGSEVSQDLESGRMRRVPAEEFAEYAYCYRASLGSLADQLRALERKGAPGSR
jgi:hypothetical protein